MRKRHAGVILRRPLERSCGRLFGSANKRTAAAPAGNAIAKAMRKMVMSMVWLAYRIEDAAQRAAPDRGWLWHRKVTRAAGRARRRRGETARQPANSRARKVRIS